MGTEISGSSAVKTTPPVSGDKKAAPAKAAPATTAKTETKANPTADKTTVSKEAGLKDDPRAKKLAEGLGDAYGSSAVKADTWKKGPNDTIEGMLKGKGFSLKDIYSKGADGKNMVDKVLGANNLKDAKKMRDGQEMIIPDLGKNGAGTATAGLKPGEKTEQKEVGAHKIQSEKLEDGTNRSSVQTNNGTGVNVDSPGKSTAATRKDGDTTKTQIVANDGQGKPSTQVDTTTQGNKDTVEAKTLNGGTLTGTASQDGVKLKNGEVKVNTDLDERKRDGGVENFGSRVDKFLGLGPKGPSPTVDVKGKQVTTTAEGNDITVSADGKPVAKFNQDADDGFFERTGAVVDKGVKYVGDAASAAGTAISNTASAAGTAISNAASGMWNWMTGG